LEKVGGEEKKGKERTVYCAWFSPWKVNGYDWNKDGYLRKKKRGKRKIYLSPMLTNFFCRDPSAGEREEEMIATFSSHLFAIWKTKICRGGGGREGGKKRESRALGVAASISIIFFCFLSALFSPKTG